MKRRGRPVLGAVSGLLFGLFLGLDLVMFKVISLGSPVVLVLPLVGLLAGIGLAFTAPFGKRAPAA